MQVDRRDMGLIPESGRSLEDGMGTYYIFLPGESRGQRSLAGYNLRVAQSQT